MDIVERLRLVDITFWWKPLNGGIDTELDVPAYELGALSHEAATEIERLCGLVNDLSNENWRFRNALERIVDCEEELDPQSFAEIVLMGR
jgi:hypothetical protein